MAGCGYSIFPKENFMKRLLVSALAVLMLFACAGFSVATTTSEHDPFEGWSDNEKFLYAVKDLLQSDSQEYAAAGVHDDNSDVYYTVNLPCSICPDGIIRDIGRTYSDWVNNGTTRQCAKIFKELDLLQSRQRTTVYQCNNCGYGFYTNSVQAQWICGQE